MTAGNRIIRTVGICEVKYHQSNPDSTNTAVRTIAMPCKINLRPENTATKFTANRLSDCFMPDSIPEQAFAANENNRIQLYGYGPLIYRPWWFKSAGFRDLI